MSKHDDLARLAYEALTELDYLPVNWTDYIVIKLSKDTSYIRRDLTWFVNNIPTNLTTIPYAYNQYDTSQTVLIDQTDSVLNEIILMHS